MRIGTYVGLMFLSLMLGCSSNTTTAYISGNVTVDGTLVELGQIFFEPIDGKSAVGAGVIEEGSFEVVCTPGKYKVLITGTRAIPGAPPIKINGEEIEAREQIVPRKYNTSTPLEEEVAPGEQTINFELES